MNKYFLLIACLQLWSSITPVAPITTWGPLIVIFMISGLKEAIDDIKRYKNDCLANERMIVVLRDGRRVEIQSQEVLVGDIVYCEENDEFPCDMVLLTSSESKTGSCYIQTSNIDGETNLKQRYVAHKEYATVLQNDSHMFKLQIEIECSTPNKNIYNFDSMLKLPKEWYYHPDDGHDIRTLSHSMSFSNSLASSSSSIAAAAANTSFPLSSDNLLLQGTYLRNTQWIYGLCVYTGNETKVGCNKSKVSQKYTKIDEFINRITISVFIVQIILILIWGIIGYTYDKSHQEQANHTSASDPNEIGSWYLGYAYSKHVWYTPLIIPLRFLLLASMMIPISLKVSLDIIKLYYSLCINWDLHFYDAERNIPAKATNTSIAENLGQVAYVLSDKTGTLTENIMIFRKCCVEDGERKYGEPTPNVNQNMSGRASVSQHLPPPSLPSLSSSSVSILSDNDAALTSNRRSFESIRSSSSSTSASTPNILTDDQLTRDLKSQHAPLVNLLKFMALCNTVVPSVAKTLPSASSASSTSSNTAFSASPSIAILPASSSGTSSAPGPRKSSNQTSSSGSSHGHAKSLEMVSSLGATESHLSVGAATFEPLFVGGTASHNRNGSSSNNGHDASSNISTHPAHGDSDEAHITKAPLLRPSGNGGYVASDSHDNVFDADHDVAASSSSSSARQPANSKQLPTSPQLGQHPVPPTKRQGSSLLNMTLANTTIHYASSSPDELSLVEFAAEVGCRLIEKEGATVRIAVDWEKHGGSSSSSSSRLPTAIEEWELLHVLEFTSDRKRMSVVIRQITPHLGPILLLTKGADDVIFTRLSSSTPIKSSTGYRRTLDAYASTGLRTLCFASREISESEYETWSAKLHAATLDIHAREARLAETYELLERDLTLVGCTGIEDKLQEGVNETIQDLREAGIKVWMLTGDRRATAEEISKSCGLYKPRSNVRRDDSSSSSSSHHHNSPSSRADDGDILYAIEGSTPGAIHASLEGILQRAFASTPQSYRAQYCLLIDGSTLSILMSGEYELRFALLALNAVSVICARTTPSQKANMVTLVKKYSHKLAHPSQALVHHILSGSESNAVLTADGEVDLTGDGSSSRDHLCSIFYRNLFHSTGEVVLAIGDGGNDCAMIVCADVGVGIYGKEGLQAARASDYSFTHFSSLKRLLLIHGRYAYNRTCFVGQYCFFKSMLICFVQLWFAGLSNWSGSSLFDSYSLVTYNLFYTSLPTLLFLFEKDLSEETLLANPQLYETCQRGMNLTRKSMGGWCARALFQSLVLILFTGLTHHGEKASDAFGEEGQISNALVIYTSCVLIHPFTIYLESTYITKIHHVILIGTILLFMLLNTLLAILSPAMDLWHVYLTLVGDGEYYLRTLLLTTLCLIPVFIYKYIQQRYFPTLVQQAHVRELVLQGKRSATDDGVDFGGMLSSDATAYQPAPI